MKLILDSLCITLLMAVALIVLGAWLGGSTYLMSLGHWWSIPIGLLALLFPISVVGILCADADMAAMTKDEPEVPRVE